MTIKECIKLAKQYGTGEIPLTKKKKLPYYYKEYDHSLEKEAQETLFDDSVLERTGQNVLA